MVRHATIHKLNMELSRLDFRKIIRIISTTPGASNLVVHMKVIPLDLEQDIAFLDAQNMTSPIGIGAIVEMDIGITKL